MQVFNRYTLPIVWKDVQIVARLAFFSYKERNFLLEKFKLQLPRITNYWQKRG